MGNEVPSTERGRRTRAQLVQAAAEVFAERRYLDTNVADIVQRAGTAYGTFYRYFTGKEEIFREVALELQRAMLTHTVEDDDAGDQAADPVDRASSTPRDFTCLDDEMLWRITRANRRYLDGYREHARLLAAIEQVATFNDQLREIRREIRWAFVERAQRSIERMQAAGLAHGDLDARYAASALGSMVDRFAYVWLVLEEPYDLDESVRTLSVLWARSLGIATPVGPAMASTQRPAARAHPPASQAPTGLLDARAAMITGAPRPTPAS